MKIILTTAILLFASALYAQDWIYVGKTPSDNSSYYMRSTSVEESDTKKVWVKNSTRISIKKAGKSITYTKGYEINLLSSIAPADK